MLQSGKKYIFWVLLFAGSLMVFNSCQKPPDKEAYLQRFNSFVERVEKSHEDYNKSDWEWADARFEKFSQQWYSEFEDELTTDEKIKVIALKIKYTSLKEPNAISNLLKNLKKEDADKIKEKIDDYIENDLDEDVGKLIDGMKEIGDSAVKVIDDIIEEIDNRF